MNEKIAKNKKWIIVVAGLVLIAIIVTLVLVLLPKDVSKLVYQTNTQTQTMFLKTEQNQKLYIEFQKKITDTIKDEKYTETTTYEDETNNVYNACLALNKVADFYNKYIVFAKQNKTFEDKYSQIMNSYSLANKAQKKMEDKIAEVNSTLKDLDSFFYKNAWTSFREMFDNYLNSYVKAFDGLCEIFKDCVPNGVVATCFTNLVLDNVDNYLAVINANFDKAEYKIIYLASFISYLNVDENNVLTSFYLSESLQEKYKLLVGFKDVFGSDKSLSSLIESIDYVESKDNVDFTFSSGVADPKGVLQIAKSFLKGELAA